MKKTDVMMIVYVLAVLMIMISIGTASIYCDCGDITYQKSLKSSGPICINGNDDFTEANGVTGGNGTESNPFIIENLGIDASTAHGIYIENTDKYFIIRNCTVQNGTSNNYGIYFYNVTNGRIDNITSYNNDCGVYLFSSSNSSIANCTVYSNNDVSICLEESNNNSVANCNIYNTDIAIYLRCSSGNIIANCTLHNNTGDAGVYLDNSNNNQLKDCDIYDNLYGVLFEYSSNNIITSSTIHDNDNIGIYLYVSSYNNITNSDCYNTSYGIHFNSSSNNNQITKCILHNNNYSIHIYDSPAGNQITNSTLYNSSDYGICITESTTLFTNVKSRVYHNNFINNGINAYDNSDNTVWDSDSPFGGNYWNNYTGIDADGDGIGDTYYNISGKTLPNQDHYPFINPIEYISPTVSSTSPDNKKVDVPVNTNITIVFSEPINKLSVKGNITISQEIGIKKYNWSEDNKTLILALSSELSSYTDYNVTINTNIKDLSQNNLKDFYNFSFRTEDVSPPDGDAGGDQEVDEATTVYFDASNSTDNSGVITNYTWTFVDNNVEIKLYNLDPNYTFTSPGFYIITLNVSDNAGNWAVDILNITVKDVTPPVITILLPMNNTITNQNITLVYFVSDNFDDIGNITVIGPDNNTVYGDEGEYTVTINATDTAGNNASQTIIFTIDKKPPIMSGISPADGSKTDKNRITVSGKTEPNATVKINYVNVNVSSDGSFSREINLVNGYNIIAITATDTAGNTVIQNITIERTEEGEEEEMPRYLVYLIAIPIVFVVALVAVIAFLKRKIVIRCPACKTVFNVKPGEKPLKIKCPKCGREGVLR